MNIKIGDEVVRLTGYGIDLEKVYSINKNTIETITKYEFVSHRQNPENWHVLLPELKTRLEEIEKQMKVLWDERHKLVYQCPVVDIKENK